MKVLWFVNKPVQAMLLYAGKSTQGGGHWIDQLLVNVSKCKEIEIGVVTAYPGMADAYFKEDGVSYYISSQPTRLPIFGMRSIDLAKCSSIIEQFKPDIIHIHGSERFYGLVNTTVRADVPVVISMQGLLGPYSEWKRFFGALSLFEIIRSIRLIELPLRLGLLWQYYDIRQAAKREKKILSSAEGFLGRTSWDRSHCSVMNPEAPYFHVGEILRPAFSQNQWSLASCNRHTLIYTNAGDPRRGTENLLSAMKILEKEFPDICLRLAGKVSENSGYGRFIRKKIDKLGLKHRVELVGYLDGNAMQRELLRSNAFVITSYIENSPNSLAEAMILGLPCVAAFTGGIPDMIEHGKTGLLFPVEDVPLLAERIKRIFTDDRLAESLGDNARRVALKRHNPEVVTSQLLAAYEQFLADDSN